MRHGIKMVCPCPIAYKHLFPYDFVVTCAYHVIGFYLFIFLIFLLQIIGGFPFTTDIVLISGTDSESSRVEERISNLTGFFPLLFIIFIQNMYVYVLSEKGEQV